jgi:hypothetical protein
MSKGRVSSPHRLATQLLHSLSIFLVCIASCVAQTAAQAISELPSAPDPHFGSNSRPEQNFERVPLPDCPYDRTHARECRVHWHQLVISSTVFMGFLNGGNVYTGYWYRWETTHGDWFQRWIDSAANWKWGQWNDDNPVLDDYVGHPMMGALTNDLWIQNDPKSMTLTQSNTWPYWRRLLRAEAFTTVYHFEWKLGPIGEAGIGHTGDHPEGHPNLFGTGDVELVTTPVVGGLWTLAEDSLDKHLVAHLEDHPRNPFVLLGISILTPAQGTANILRFRPPWYRDSRVVKAASFWSDPPPPYDRETAEIEAYEASRRAAGGNPNSSEQERAAEPSSSPLNPVPAVALPPRPQLPQWPRPGGVHEFGAWWGMSLISGHIWGYAGDIKYMPIDVRYSYLLSEHDHWTLRYSPEVTALAMLDEPVPGQTNRFLMRKRTYGSGVSPAGFQSDFFPSHRVQPFLSGDGGAIYFTDRVLSSQGSRFMYTIDFGCGINIFRKPRQAVSIGYRYQHLSNANISEHNPGTDANTFYVAVSRFRTKGYR